MSHLEAGLLHALLDGEIASPDLAPIEAHLAGCAECRARLEQERLLFAEAEGLVETLEVPAGEATPGSEAFSRPRLRWGRPLAWAASVIAAAGLGYAARGVTAPRASGELATQQPTARADSPGVVASTPSADVEPVVNAPESRQSTRIAGSKPPGARSNVALLPSPQEGKVASERSLEMVTPPVGLSDSTRKADSTRRAAEPAAAAPAAGALGGRLAAKRLGDQTLRLEEVVVTEVSQAGAAKAALTPPEPISLPDAIRRLGGSLRLIDGLIPLRLEAQGVSVRVVYAVAQGELVLSQQLIDGRVLYTLIPPAGFPPDSLPRLKARVRE